MTRTRRGEEYEVKRIKVDPNRSRDKEKFVIVNVQIQGEQQDAKAEASAQFSMEVVRKAAAEVEGENGIDQDDDEGFFDNDDMSPAPEDTNMEHANGAVSPLFVQ